MLNVPKYLVIALSAIGGAALVVAGWFILTGAIPTDNITWFAIGNEIADSFIWLVVWLGIAVVGFIAQMATGTLGPRQLRAGPGELSVRFDLTQG